MIAEKRKSFDGTEIFVTVWDEVEDPKAVVMISHGVSEYGARYDSFARYLNSRGFIVFCDDHRAHGRTEPPEELGRHIGDVFSDTVRDEIYFYRELKEEYGLPVFFLGHSYGSFIGQAFAQAGTDVRAVALLGSAHLGAEAAVGKVVVAPLALVAGKWRPRIVNIFTDTMFSFKGDSGRSQWLTRDSVNRGEFIADPLCGIDLSLAFDYSMICGVSSLYGKASAGKLNRDTRIALFSGDKDPIGGNGKKVRKLEKFYRKYGVPVEVHLYKDMRHEIVNEIGKEVPRKEIADFFMRFV